MLSTMKIMVLLERSLSIEIGSISNLILTNYATYKRKSYYHFLAVPLNKDFNNANKK